MEKSNDHGKEINTHHDMLRVWVFFCLVFLSAGWGTYKTSFNQNRKNHGFCPNVSFFISLQHLRGNRGKLISFPALSPSVLLEKFEGSKSYQELPHIIIIY